MIPGTDFYNKQPSTSCPGWYDDNSKPCQCDKTEHKPVEIMTHSGYSDSLYLMLECPKCKAFWCDWIEG